MFTLDSTVQQFPDHPYHAIKDAILGKRYQLSLTFVGQARARSLNQRSRSRSYVPDVLSYPLTQSVGEIYLCPHDLAPKARERSLSVSEYVLFLFVHGCLHLKGYEHSDAMDKLEQKFCKKFGVTLIV
jgi:probable rRNA maturation factor